MAASSRISPAWFMPISSTRGAAAIGQAQDGERHADVIIEIAHGLAHRQVRLPAGARWRPWWWSCPRCPSRRPPCPPHCWRAQARQVLQGRLQAYRLTTQARAGRRGPPPSASTTTAAAPFSSAAATKSCPSWFGPRSAKYTSPGSVSGCPRSSPPPTAGGGLASGSHGARNVL